MFKRLALLAFAVSCVAAHAQMTQITGAHIASFGGAPITGKFCLTPTDSQGNSINLTTSTGQQFAPRLPLCFAVTAGVLSNSAIVPDVSLSQPRNVCMRLALYDNAGQQVGSYKCLQPSGATWNFDTFVPATLPSIPAVALPVFSTNGTPNSSQVGLNIVCSGCVNSGSTITFPSGGSGGGFSNENLTFSATPVFSLATTSSHIALNGNITNFSLASGADGQHKCLTFAHDGTTNQYTVTPPANVVGFFYVATMPEGANKRYQQCFTYYTADNVWVAESPGVLNQ
jgi:hypothetical protein